MPPVKRKKYNAAAVLSSAIRKVWLYSPSRREAIKRAGGCGLDGYCEECGITRRDGAKLDVHHIEHVDLTKEAKRLAEKLLPEPDKLLTLCTECHKEAHKHDR